MNEVRPIIVMAAGMGSRMRADADVPRWALEEAAQRPKAMIRLGRDKRPLLAWILQQAGEEGLTHACVVISEEDNITRPHFSQHPVQGLELDFVIQRRPPGRSKPEGTAQAVQLALEAHPEWKGASVLVANGDNLPPAGMFARLLGIQGLPAFDREHLGLPPERTEAFAVIHHDRQPGRPMIEEKPSADIIEAARWPDGTIRVSMNYFRLPYGDLLQAVRNTPFHPERHERELPVGISQWASAPGSRLEVMPMAGAFLDLTHPRDILTAGEQLDGGGYTLLD